ncbi:MAG: chemotaxis protein CheD [Clostridium sp.]|uniref:chemotaxis protein CheD n=1 Tax=Clostridium sp. TaxID=1506 RepID=UPI003F32F2EF
MGLKDKIVGISEIYVGRDFETIITIGLGSCVGVIVYDDKNSVSGLAHVMLSDSTLFKNTSNPAKFVDSAIPLLITEIIKKGGLRANLKCKLVGGASMFNFSDSSIISDVGKRNVLMAKEVLKKENIEIIAEDTLGKKGRTIYLDSKNGEISVKTVGGGIKIL